VVRRPVGTIVAAALAAAVVAGSGELVHAALGRDAARHRHAVSTDPLAQVRVNRPASPAKLTMLPRFRRLYSPDVIVYLSKPFTRPELRRVDAIPGVRGVTVLDLGRVQTPAAFITLAGVNPSGFRAFTPRLTAISTLLWEAVAQGEVALSFGELRKLRADFGRPLSIRSVRTTTLRLGAFASLGIAGVDGVVSHDVAMKLGLRPARAILVSAPSLSIDSLRYDLHAILGPYPRTNVVTLRPQPFDQLLISQLAVRTIPSAYLLLYREAATTCPGLPWTVLAGIGAVETGHGANDHVSSAGAEGPMQFLPSTWAVYGISVHPGQRPNIWDPADAIFSAARYLCYAGAGRGGQSLDYAIYAYNHAWWYVRDVLDYALAYQ
jgi:hypothetical protein